MKVKKLIENNQNKIVIYSDEQVAKLLKNINNTNKNLNLNQFTKLLNSDMMWYALINDDSCLSLCAIKKNALGINDYYINEIGSFYKGAGKELLKHLINKFDTIWLMSEPGNERLIDYYKQFGLKEFTLEKNIYNVPVTYFYKGSDKLVNLITKYYS